MSNSTENSNSLEIFLLNNNHTNYVTKQKADSTLVGGIINTEHSDNIPLNDDLIETIVDKSKIDLDNTDQDVTKNIEDDPKLKPYSLGTLFAIASNFAIGSGILAIPHCIANNGIIISVIFLILSTLGVAMSAGMYIEFISRYHAIHRSGFTYQKYKEIKAQRKIKKNAEKAIKAKIISDIKQEESISSANEDLSNIENEDRVLVNNEIKTKADEFVQLAKPDFHIPQSTSPELTAIMKTFFGNGGMWLWQLVIFVYMFGTLMGYGNVVASSLASSIPLTTLPDYKKSGVHGWVCVDPASSLYPNYCNEAYYIWSSVTLVLSLIICCFDVADQKILQTIFTVCRYLVVLMVVILTSIAYTQGPFDLDSNPPPRDHAPYSATDVELWHFGARDIGSIIPSLVFSMTIHHSTIPLVGPVKKSQKKGSAKTMYLLFIFLGSITAISSFVCGMFFGKSKKSADLVTLNFASWNGKEFFPKDEKQPIWASIITKILILLPPIYVITAIPLNAITLASNILELLPIKFQKKKWMKILIRLLCTGIPVIISMFWRSLGAVISFCGLAGFFIMYFCPAMGCQRAGDMSDLAFEKEQNQPTSNANICEFNKKSKKIKTDFTTWYHCNAIYYGYYIYGGIAFVLTVYSLIEDIVHPMK